MGFVLLPNEEMERYLVRVSQEARQYGNRLVLNTTHPRGPRPHLSLFHMMVDEPQIPAIIAAVACVVMPVVIEGECFKMHLFGGNWLFLQTRGDRLLELQDLVVRCVESLRSGDVEVSWEMSPVQQQAHRTFGYPNVGEAWDTHFTYGYVADGSLVPEPLRNLEVDLTWTARAIAVVRIGDHGTAGEILYVRHLARLST